MQNFYWEGHSPLRRPLPQWGGGHSSPHPTLLGYFGSSILTPPILKILLMLLVIRLPSLSFPLLLSWPYRPLLCPSSHQSFPFPIASPSHHSLVPIPSRKSAKVSGSLKSGFVSRLLLIQRWRSTSLKNVTKLFRQALKF